MYYETKLLPLDNAGHFILAQHFSQYSIGGENTRETAYARFAVGHIDRPRELRDLTALCTLPRPASPIEAEHHRMSAQGQGELARSGNYGEARAKEYALNERRELHAAALAMTDTVYVPRRVATSRKGHALLGFDMATHVPSYSPRSTVRLIDALQGASLLDNSSQAPESVQTLARFLAVSLNGSHLLKLSRRNNVLSIMECGLQPGLPESATLPGIARQTFVASRRGWIGLDEDSIRIFAYGNGRKQAEFKLPHDALGWVGKTTIDGEYLAISGKHGTVWVVSLRDGNARCFHPHRGINRGIYPTIDISDCGAWLASRAGEELVVTRLEDGVSWPLAELRNQVREDISHGGFVVTSHLPAAFGFIGSRLLVVEGDEMPREIPLVELPADAIPFVSEQGRPGARMPLQVPANAPFDELMEAAGLASAAARIKPHYSPALRIKPEPLEKAGWKMPTDSKAPALGASRFGGWPDLPAEIPWPLWQERPMSFLAQINLEEAHAVQPSLCLPKRGLLAFFLGCDDQFYEKNDDPRPRYMADVMLGTEPTHRGAWRVIYVEEVLGLQRREYTRLPLPELHEPCALRFSKGGKPLPDEMTMAYERLGLNIAQRDNYNELLGLLSPDEESWTDQLMGYPNLIQSTPPEMMCELASRGLNPWRFPQESDSEHEELTSAASEWGLLLQLTSGSKAGFEWGDGGHFYFYGHRAAMQAGDFSGVWVNFEN